MRFIILLFLFLTSLWGMAQTKIYEDFELEQVNDQIYVTWAIKQGNSCNGIEVQRSLDSINFVKVYEIPGICGSNSKKEFYEFTDTTVTQNQKYYYRLRLGVLGVSSVRSINFYSTLGKKVLIYPNPSKDGFTFIFNEEKYNKITFYNLNGQEVWSFSFDQIKSIRVYPKLTSGIYIVRSESKEGSNLQKVILN